ncbi:MAG: hypothetical protein P9M11_03655 [Candidatus Tenebribacter burtonii]|nr:hypothetical protein [Candidatus Tenebribacter burtonii]
MKIYLLIVILIIPFFLVGIGINFSFDNDELTNNAGVDYFEFDIMANATATGTRIGTGIVLIDYNINAFGQSVSNNNKLTVTKGTLLQNPVNSFYNVIQNDNQPARFAITFEYLGDDNGNQLLLGAQQLLHVKLEIADTQEYSGLSFNSSLMDGQQYYSNNTTKYDPVTANDVLDVPLPVTLSSFTTVYSNNQPIINWVTQSESNDIGWNIYRANSSNLGQASILNFNTIPGNGTTSEPSYYSFIDEYDVYENFTYWYWLESICGSGETEMFGPVSLTIPLDNNYIPEIPMETELNQNFPNPFNPSTSISFDIKENETGLLSIYNVKDNLL